MKKNNSPYRDSNFLILTTINIGGALEWYEIGMFISWQLIIQESTINFEAIAASFNVGAVLLMISTMLAFGGARAIGGWFFGRKGDRQGRKSAFPLTIFIATIPSWGLVLLSFFLSYKEWITYSTIILTTIKIFQGVPAGGELPGAICYLSEDSEAPQEPNTWDNHRYMCSYTLLGPQIGLAVSTIACLILKLFFPIDILLNHGWRCVFFISGIMGIGGFIIRKKLHETIAFLKRKIHHKITYSPLKAVFHSYRSQLAFGFTLPIFEVVSFSVLSVMPLYYLRAPFNFTQGKITLMSLSSSILCIILLPLIGFFSSKYKKFPWLNVSAWSVIPLSLLLYKFLLAGDFLFSIIINTIMVFLFSIQASILPSLLARLFPVHVRYTGIAFSFNICDGILWTIITSTCFWFISYNNPAFVLYIPISAIIFLITFKWFKTQKKTIGRFFI